MMKSYETYLTPHPHGEEGGFSGNLRPEARGWVPKAAPSLLSSLPFLALTGSLPKWVVNKSSQFLAPKVSGLESFGLWRLMERVPGFRGGVRQGRRRDAGGGVRAEGRSYETGARTQNAGIRGLSGWRTLEGMW